MILISQDRQLQRPGGPYPWGLPNGIGGGRQSPRMTSAALLPGAARPHPEHRSQERNEHTLMHAFRG